DDSKDSEKNDKEPEFDVILDEASLIVADMLRGASPVTRLVDTNAKRIPQIKIDAEQTKVLVR
ncbi:MAG: hypothetical protein VCB59_11485, partial [Gammaproteobacteria bacterium]